MIPRNKGPAAKRSKTKVARRTIGGDHEGLAFDEFYDALKKNVKEGASLLATSTCATPDELASYTEEHSIDDSKNKLLSYADGLHRAGIKCTKYKAIIGLELANLKCLYLNNKCDKCRNGSNELDIVSCKSCTNSKTNSTADFFKFAMSIVKCTSNDYINHYIAIGKLCKQYPKFVLNTMPADLIKKHFSMLKVKMNNDSIFWSTGEQIHSCSAIC